MVIKARDQVLGQIRIGRRGAGPADLRKQLLRASDGRRPLGLSQPCTSCLSYRSLRDGRP